MFIVGYAHQGQQLKMVELRRIHVLMNASHLLSIYRFSLIVMSRLEDDIHCGQ